MGESMWVGPMRVEVFPIVPVSFDLAGAAAATGLSQRTLQTAVKDGDLVAHYSGTKPIVAVDELRAYIEALPTAPHHRQRRR